MKLKSIRPIKIRVAIMATLAMLLLMTAIGLAQTGGDFTLSRWSINNGGGESDGGSFTVRAILGQPDAGALMEGGQFSLQGGFGPPEDRGPTEPPADHGLYLPMVLTP